MKALTAPEVLGVYLSKAPNDIKTCRHDPSRFGTPSVYKVDGVFYAAPSNKRPPKHHVGRPWEKVGEALNRPVYKSDPVV